MVEERKDAHDGQYEMLKKLRPGRAVIPVIIGLAVIIWFITKDLNLHSLKEITFTWRSVFWLTTAILFLCLRTFSYMARIRILTGNKITWLQSFRIIMLWEFTSAITPSTVGGTAVAVIFLNKEGISVGQSASVVLATSFLDELYFVVSFPLLVLLIGWKTIFITSIQGSAAAVMNNLIYVALVGYGITLAWVLFVGYGLFFKPGAIRKSILAIFRLPFLRKWQKQAEKSGDDIVSTSKALRKESVAFWAKILLHTFITWTSRYLLVNAILMAFFYISDHLLIFARQLILWIMMIISPTPGGAGFAEIILGRYLSDLIPVDVAHAHGISLAMAVIWRILSYYPFIIAGALMLPGWIGRKFIHRSNEKK